MRRQAPTVGGEQSMKNKLAPTVMEKREMSEMVAVVTLVEEDGGAELAPLSGYPAAVVRRRARFLRPRAEADPAPAPRRPLLRDLITRRQGQPWPPWVLFRGWYIPDFAWHRWVQRLRPVYGNVWRSAGIWDAITVSTCTVLVDDSIFWGLLECWCPETNTFVFPWPWPAEATVTLEDVMVLGGFSVLGEPVRAAAAARGPEEEELLAWLMAEHGAMGMRNSSSQVSHHEWTSRFMGFVAGKPGRQEHAAFLALWLSRYVFPAPPHGSVGRRVFPLAVRLAGGARVALAPTVLARIYRDLRVLKQFAVGAGGVDTWGPFQLLQLWAWEHFESLRPPKPPSALSQGKARSMRWDNLGHQPRSLASVRTVLESPGEFRWRPYAAILMDWRYPSFYCYVDRWVTVGSGGEDEDMRSYIRCLRACELVGLDSVEHYAPQRVAMQFGLDQDLPGSIPPVHGAWELAWATYDGGGERVRLYVPPRFNDPCATRRFLDWQKQCALDRTEEAGRMALRFYVPPRVYDPCATRRFLDCKEQCALYRTEEAGKMALDRTEEVGKMARRRKREKEKRRRLRKKAKGDSKSTGFTPDPERGLQSGTQESHGPGLSPVAEEPPKLQEQEDEQRRRKGEILMEDGALKPSALEVFDHELRRVKEGYVMETNEQPSSCCSSIPKEPERGMPPSRVTCIEIESDDEELQRRTRARLAAAASPAAGPVPEFNMEKEDDALSTDVPGPCCGLVMSEEPETGMSPSRITFIEIESDDEELQRKKDLEFEREIDQLKAEIASLLAMKAAIESQSARVEPATARLSHLC